MQNYIWGVTHRENTAFKMEAQNVAYLSPFDFGTSDLLFCA